MTSKQRTVTCIAPVNIAVVKYWGKRDEKKVLPINSSLSVTLHTDNMRAKTTIMADSGYSEDRMWLNDQEESVTGNARLLSVLKTVREMAAKKQSSDACPPQWALPIWSENNFPTAAGLASSAAGYACLVYTLATLYGVKDHDVSQLARLGSGSACRSVYGGFVSWDAGECAEGSDSRARQVASHDHWPGLRVLILVVSGQKKHTGSTEGMRRSVATSSLLAHRAAHLVPETMTRMEKAVLSRDFEAFAELTMRDSNQMHACCLDTFPPVTYMTDVSRDIQRMVHAVNSYSGKTKVGYTFDAGPNACLYLLQEDVSLMLGLVRELFPPSTGSLSVRGLPADPLPPPQDLLDRVGMTSQPGALQYVIHTQPGPGPQELGPEHSLFSERCDSGDS